MIYTQEQLEAMVNAQIDAIIFALIYGHIGSDKDMKRIWDSKKISYCNNWADIGPLIFESGISIINDSATSTATNDPYAYVCLLLADIKGKEFGYKKSECISSEHENQLRAAAIVYILIEQGGQK